MIRCENSSLSGLVSQGKGIAPGGAARMGQNTNNKYQIEDRRIKRLDRNSWKRVQVWDTKNYGCGMCNGRDFMSIIDYRLDKDCSCMRIKHVAGVNIRGFVLATILLADRDVRKFIKENWDAYASTKFSMCTREGQTGHKYISFHRWFTSAQYISKDVYKMELTSNDKIDRQASPDYVPIWALIAYDMAYRIGSVADKVNSYKSYFEKCRKPVAINLLRKRGIKIKYTPGYRLSVLDYEDAKKNNALLDMRGE